MSSRFFSNLVSLALRKKPLTTSQNTIQPNASTIYPLILKGKNDPVTQVAITWQHIANATTSGNTVTKNSGAANGFNAGADSVETIIAGKNGYVSYTIPSSFVECCVGLNFHANNSHLATLIDYGIYMATSTQIQTIEFGGAAAVLDNNYLVGDVYTVDVTDSVVTYKRTRSGVTTVLKTSANTPTFPLFCAVNIQQPGGSATATYVIDNSGQQAVDLLQLQDGTASVLCKIDNLGRFVASSGFALARTNVAASYTVAKADFWLNITSTAAARTMTMKSASTYGVNQMFIFTDGSNAAGTNNITIALSGSDTFWDGTTSKVINTNGGVLRVACDGTSKWYLL